MNYILIYLYRTNSFTCVMVLIANSTLVSCYVTVSVIITPSPLPHVQSSTRGTVNGIGQSLVAVSRSIGPLIGAPVFAWSASNSKRLCVTIDNIIYDNNITSDTCKGVVNNSL